MSVPKIIYLQVTDTDYDLGGEFTWCQDKINDEDIEYIRMEEYASLRSENDDLHTRLAESDMKQIELKEEIKSENYWAREYMRLMLEAREEYRKLRRAYINTRQTMSNVGLGMLKGENQLIAMNEVANIDKVLNIVDTNCICEVNPQDERYLIVNKNCMYHGFDVLEKEQK